MADSIASVKILVKADGLDKAVKDSAQIADNIERANSASARMGSSAAVKSAYKESAASKSAPNTSSSTTSSLPGETKTARSIGAGGGTGSAASDFAAQASGLGGLVHVYATFAANLFAVSAAFTALSKSMDITNLVAGLDQIGAASGRNLGSLAKQMVKVTDNAISMQQALTSTALASSGGMTNDQILRMTKVAQQASIALGRDMPDSMDRLTKGIVKSQPELLDELGIMTRMIPAQQAYAEKIGKTISSLSTFEKQQAFTNAVLEEGEKKFSAIELHSNPYSKILSSTENLLQSGLELVNKVLGPIVEMLSKSPAGLTAVLAGIGTVLLKQALPAIGMFKDNARRAAEEAYALAERKAIEAENASIDRDTMAMARAKAIFQKSQAGIDAAKPVNSVRFNSRAAGTELTGVMRKSAASLTSEDISLIRDSHAKLASLDEAQMSKSEKNLQASLQRKLAMYIRYDAEVEDAELKAAEASYTNRQKSFANQEDLSNRIFAKHKDRANKTQVVSSAVDITSTQGLRAGFSTMMTDIRDKDMKGWNKWSTMVSGSIGIVTQKASSIISAFGILGQIAALIVAGLELVDLWASKATKEAGIFTDSADNVKSSLANLDKTLEVISKKDPKQFLSIESMQAKANAINNLSSSVTKLVEDYNNLLEKQNGYDKAKDFLASAFFDSGSIDTLRKNLAKGVSSAFKGLDASSVKSEAVTALQSLLGEKVDLGNFDAVDEAMKNLSDHAKVLEAERLAPKALQDIANAAEKAAAPLTAFKAALESTSKQFTVVTNSLIPSDEYSKLGIEFSKASSTMSESMKQGPIDSLLSLQALSGNMQNLSLLPKNTAMQVATAKKEIDDLQQSIAALQQAKIMTESTIKDNKATFTKEGFLTRAGTDAKLSLDSANAVLLIEEKAIAEKTASAERIKETFKNLPNEMAQASFQLLAKGLAVAMNEAAVNSAKGFLSIMQQAGVDTSVESIDLAKQQIAIQISGIKANFNLIESQAKLTAAVERANLFAEQLSIKDQINDPLTGANKTKLYEKLNINRDAIAKNDSKMVILADHGATAKADAKVGTASQATLDAMKEMQPYMTSLIGMWSQLAGKDSELYVLNLQKAVAEKVAIITEDNKQLDLQAIALSNEKSLLDTKKGTASYMSDELTLAYRTNAEKTLQATAEKKINDISKEQVAGAVALVEAQRLGKADAVKSIKESMLLNYQRIELVSEDLKVAKEHLKITIDQANETARIKYESEVQNVLNNDIFSTSSELLANKQTELKYLQDIGAITAKSYTDQQASVALEQQSLVYANEKRLVIEKYKADILANDTAGGDLELQAKHQQGIVDALIRQLNLLGLKNEATVNSITLEAAHKSMIDAQTESMNKMVSVTESLTNLFGEMGTNIGNAGKALLLMSQDDEKYTVAKLAAEKATAAARDDAKTNPDGYKNAIKNEIDLDNKAKVIKLNNISATASATKKMFAEHTEAYKVLNAIEKASEAYKLAIQVKEIAMDLKKYAIKIGLLEKEAVVESAQTSFMLSEHAAAATADVALTGTTEAAKNTLKTPGVFMSFMNWLGPFGMAAAGLAIAAVLSSSGGGGTTVNTSGLTSADMQKSQGTGQSWSNRQLVDNGGGVFGDTSAKSNSIQNSLDLIAATSVEGLSFSNKQTELLGKINEGIKGIATTAYGVQGIRSGSGFGTVEGSSGGSSGILSFLFGSSSSSTSIINSGIKLLGTFKSLGIAGDGIIQQFETVSSTSTSSGFLGGLFGGGSTSTSISTNMKPLEAKAATAVRETFQYMGDLLVESGKKLNLTMEETITRANSLSVDITTSLKGLTGKETQDELNAVFSSILDDAYAKVAPNLKKFKQFGEGFAETVTRVINGFDKVNLSLTSMGLGIIKFTEVPSKATTAMYNDQAIAKEKMDKAIAAVPTAKYDFVQLGNSDRGINSYQQINQEDITAANKLVKETTDAYKASSDVVIEANAQMTTKGYDLSEALIKAAGGLDKFLESAKLYTDTFLTEAQKLEINKTGATDRLKEIGGSKLDTTNYDKVATETNSIAMELFKTFSDGNDAIINTKAEYKALIDASLEGSKVVVSEEDKLGLARRQSYIDLYAQLTDPALLTAQQKIWDAEDASNKSKYTQATELLNLQDKSYEATIRDRNTKLEELQLTDATLITGQKLIYAQEDINKTNALTIELLNAENKTSEALIKTRSKELLGLSDSDAALKIRIWRLQDEAALLAQKNSQEASIYTLLGNSAAALQITREKELSTMDEQLKPAQLYLYALQDEATLKGKLKTAYDREKASIKSTIDSISGLVKTLQDAKSSMLIGNQSILTPTERYAEAKRQAESVAAIATGIAVTDSEIATRNDAISKLPSVTSTFLDASRELYSSSEQYTKDFNSVLKILDDTSNALDVQKTDAQNQLDKLTSIDSVLASMLEDTTSSAVYLKQLADLAPLLLSTKTAAANSGSVASGGTNIDPVSNSIPSYESKAAISAPLAISGSPESKIQLLYQELLNRVGDPGGVTYWLNLLNSGMEKTKLVSSFASESVRREPATATYLARSIASGNVPPIVPGFAKGGIAQGLSIVGEKGPELIDFNTPTRVYSNTASNQLLNNKELIDEIRRLRNEVSQLRAEQKEQTGYLITASYDSNNKAAKAVADATDRASSNEIWAKRSQLKLA
jgi:hypothetical protein